jgi:hypothetical protein
MLDVVLPHITEEDITQLGFKIREFVPEYEIAKLKDRVQIREERHVAPKANVMEYAERMKNEPTEAILVTADGYTVDGNTRIAAAKKIKRQFLPAYVLEVNYDEADQKTKDRVEILAARANRHGTPLDKREKRKAVRGCITQGWKTDMIGYYIGVTPSAVTQVKNEIAAEDKMKKIGMSENGLSGASLRALGQIAEVNDKPFEEIAKLASDAGLNAGEIKALGKQVREAGADKTALDLIKAERVAREESIQELKLTGSSSPPPARKLKQHLGFINGYSERPGVLVEPNPEYVDEYVEALEASVATLAAVLREQKAR